MSAQRPTLLLLLLLVLLVLARETTTNTTIIFNFYQRKPRHAGASRCKTVGPQRPETMEATVAV